MASDATASRVYWLGDSTISLLYRDDGRRWSKSARQMMHVLTHGLPWMQPFLPSIWANEGSSSRSELAVPGL